MTTPPAVAGSDVALEMSGVSKQFGRTRALHDVSFRVRRGTVHALLGENGAGKSTLMRIAFGLTAPDAGSTNGGRPSRRITSPAGAMAAGIGMVHQHFANVPAMTVAENVAVGGQGAFRAARAAQLMREIGERTGLSLDPNAVVNSLPVGAQQRLEIVKALSRNATLLLLDEPTAVLVPKEAAELLAWLKAFAREGNSVVLITHRLREALSVADEVTVLRRGEVVSHAPAHALDERALARALLGDDDTEPEAPGEARRAADPTQVVARLDGVSVVDDRGATVVRNATLNVRAGEIVGVAAVEGSGQHSLLRVLAARTAPSSGTATLPAHIGFVPEDRQRDALVLDFSLLENVALRGAGSRRGRIRWRDERVSAEQSLRAFDVRAGDVAEPARSLSGGNQQKLVLARELSDSPALLVAENPTRGLDIRATRDVHARLRDVAKAGAGVVVHSSDLDEVLALADRVVVMHASVLHEVAGERDEIGRAMLGVA